METKDKVILQQYRNIDIQIFVLDYDFNIIDEISGIVETADFSIDNNSDIRRTANISMLLKSNLTNTGILNDVYFQSGNGYWFDKYLRINIGIEDITTGKYEWFKQGVYLINEPSISYDAITNSVSFQAVDLMSKMTGMRNGYLEGQAYSISVLDEDGKPTGNTITGAMADLLKAQGFTRYVLFTPETNVIPYDINIDAGSTSYDMLSELRDINPNWEIFFDVDGVFYFQKIPSGEVTLEDGLDSYDAHPTPVLDDNVWSKLLISYDLSTSFENIKNYVEVYGKAFEGERIYQATDVALNGYALTANLPFTIDNTLRVVSVSISSEGAKMLDKKIFTATFSDNSTVPQTISITCEPQIKYNNETYLFEVYKNNDGVIEGNYIGYIQPQAVAWEDNPNSPFFVGALVNTNKFNAWSGADSYDVGDIVHYGGALWTCVKAHTSTNPQIPNDKYAEYWVKINSMDAIYGELPLFEKMVRGVCVGGDYDNIATNQIALENTRFELYNHCRLHDTITINCVPIYWLDVSKIIAITLPNEGEPSYWLVNSISTSFQATGIQTITATRYYPQYPIFGKKINYTFS